uniref:Uncharacterized protein n=1 Tax=Octopus bimaculoides TaxID=37653 RepID=A0A0L8G5I2_OCTBM
MILFNLFVTFITCSADSLSTLSSASTLSEVSARFLDSCIEARRVRITRFGFDQG